MKSRHAHILRNYRGDDIPQRVLFFDTETIPTPAGNGRQVHNLRLGVAAYVVYGANAKPRSRAYSHFTTGKQLAETIERYAYAKSRLYLVAHNIGFDLRVAGLFGHLQRRGWKLKKLFIKGTAGIFEWKRGTCTILGVDNMNWFKMPLSGLGEEIGIPKLPMPAFDESNKIWYPYCQRDVDVMIEAWTIWLTFLRENDLGSFGKTIAGQSLNTYRHRFMPHDIFIHNNAEAIALERESYHGGRVECFHIGKLSGETFYNLDVNSMYPSVMRDNEYPVKLVAHIIDPTLHEIKTLLTDHALVARCVVRTREPIYAAHYKGRLTFPTGKFTTTLTTREIVLALERGDLVSVERAAIYKKARIFEQYITFFYAKRQEYKAASQSSFAYCCKLLLNSLYGKFGQQNDEWKEIDDSGTLPDGYTKIWDYQAKKWIVTRTLGGRTEEATGKVEAHDAFPAIASHVTADARLTLYRYIQLAGRDNVFYCDTDSIFTNEKGRRRLDVHIEKGTLGKLDIKATAKTLHIRAPKDYRFGETETLKGIRKDATKISANEYEQVKFEGLLGSIHSGTLDKVYMWKVRKKLSRIYKKGNVSRSGKVTPIKLT